jgi:hypothetical protein
MAESIDDDCLEKSICMADFFLNHRKLADTLKINRTPEMRILDKCAVWMRQSRDVRDVNLPTSFPIRGDGSLQQSMKQQNWMKGDGGIKALEAALENLVKMSWGEIADDRFWPRSDLLSLRW